MIINFLPTITQTKFYPKLPQKNMINYFPPLQSSSLPCLSCEAETLRCTRTIADPAAVRLPQSFHCRPPDGAHCGPCSRHSWRSAQCRSPRGTDGWSGRRRGRQRSCRHAPRLWAVGTIIGGCVCKERNDELNKWRNSEVNKSLSYPCFILVSPPPPSCFVLSAIQLYFINLFYMFCVKAYCADLYNYIVAHLSAPPSPLTTFSSIL